MDSILWCISYFLVVAGLSAYGLHRYWMIYLFYRHKKDHPQPANRFQELPVVTVQLPVYNELYVVERLIRSVAALDYPQDKLEIQVLDDSTDETVDLAASVVNELASQGFDIKHIRRPHRQGFKAGALAYGSLRARGEFFAIFDADFVPTPNILKDTINYFTDPKIGMIQTRWGHLNRDFSLLTRVQSLFLDGHLLIEQTARNRSGRFLNFNGTAGIWRKSCIEDAGGWHHDTLTEDLDLSYRAQIAGWRFIFLPHLVTPAELPVEMNAFKSQQHRWAKGSVQTCKKLLPQILSSNLPKKIKLEAFFHLTSNFAYLLLAFMCLLLHPTLTAPKVNSLAVWLIDVPVFTAASLSVAVFYFVAVYELSPTWRRDLAYLPALIALGIGLSLNNGKAVLEALFNHETEFARTPKYGVVGRKRLASAPRYLVWNSVTPILEACLAGYYFYFFYFAMHHRIWGSVPFLLLFLFGFAYVSSLSFIPKLEPIWARIRRS